MLAIIPARGGSKGLPGKNIKDLLGKPLIGYTIEAALRSKNIESILVSTDSNEIANVARSLGAKVPFIRPDHLSHDTAQAIDVYLHAINYQMNQGNRVDNVIVLQPTSPLRSTEDIDSAIEMFYTKKADSVISYCKEHHPIYWHKRIDESGKFIDIFKENTLVNRQELGTSYFPNGSIYVFKRELLESRRYYSENSFAYIMPRNRSVDIDTLDDFELAEFYLKKL